MSFKSPNYSYGGGAGRFIIAKVKNRKDDEEQSGRLQVEVVGHQEGGQIDKSHLVWGRPVGPITNPQDGGIGGPITGATEESYVTGYYMDGQQGQQLVITGTLPKAGNNANGSGNLDKSGRNASLNRHSRDPSHDGGDFAYDSEKKEYRQKSIIVYADEESENPHKRKKSKEGDKDPGKVHTIAQPYQYA